MPYAFCAKAARLGALPAVPVDGRRLLRGAKSILVGRRADCQRGLGLGLNLCQAIVALHGGKIIVQDRQPTGTLFQFTLPVACRAGCEHPQIYGA